MKESISIADFSVCCILLVYVIGVCYRCMLSVHVIGVCYWCMLLYVIVCYYMLLYVIVCYCIVC